MNGHQTDIDIATWKGHARKSFPRAWGIYFASLALGSFAGCSCPAQRPADNPSDQVVLNLWHTYNPEETETLNVVIKHITDLHPRWRVQSTVIPFARAQNEFRQAAQHCPPGAPDVFRAELPWVPEFVSKKLIIPLGAEAPAEAEFLPLAVEASRYQGQRWALPANLDCLALFYNRSLVPKPPATIKELIELAQRLTVDSAGHHSQEEAFQASKTQQWGFYVRADAYWFLPWLWAEGGDLLDPRSGQIFIDQAPAIAALTLYRDLIRVHHIAPPRPSPSNDYEDQLRRFVNGEVAMIVNGPWAMSSLLSSTDKRKFDIAVAPFPRGSSTKPAAPSSGHGFVVSRCARQSKLAWRLATLLSDAPSQIKFARQNSLLPARKAVYTLPETKQNPYIGQFLQALSSSRARPQHPSIARIFDDFNPAVQAVLLNDADPAAALTALARAWRRLLTTAGERSNLSHE